MIDKEGEKVLRTSGLNAAWFTRCLLQDSSVSSAMFMIHSKTSLRYEHMCNKYAVKNRAVDVAMAKIGVSPNIGVRETHLHRHHPSHID